MMKQIALIHAFFLLSCGFAAGCDTKQDGGAESDTRGDRENTSALCKDGADNDGDGATDCDDADCQTIEVCLSLLDTEAADISGMPIPKVDDIPRPSGSASNLVILDWAGFEAALTYSFDDTHPSQLEHYPALRDTGIRMTFFAVSAVAEDDEEGWRRVAEDGNEIGNHTAHHCKGGLSECAFGDPLESAQAEIETCSEYITENLAQTEVWTMASPYGDPWWNLTGKSYFFLNRSVNDGFIAPNDDSNPLNLPSVMLSGDATEATFIDDIDAAHDGEEWLIFCIHAVFPTETDASWGIDIDAILSSIRHGQALGDLWIDSMVNVGAYWLGQKILAAVEPKTEGEETVWTWKLQDNFPPGKYLRVKVDGGALKQSGRPLTWSSHGYYEVALDEGALTLSPS